MACKILDCRCATIAKSGIADNKISDFIIFSVNYKQQELTIMAKLDNVEKHTGKGKKEALATPLVTMTPFVSG